MHLAPVSERMGGRCSPAHHVRQRESRMRAFPSWFLRITCDRCGKATLINEAHTDERRGTMLLRVLISRMRHDGCGGRAGRAELLTGIEGVSSRPVRRIVLIAG
jgi:hypothetical protein